MPFILASYPSYLPSFPHFRDLSGVPGKTANTSSLLRDSAFPASASVLISKVALPSQTLTFKKDIQNVLEARKFGEQDGIVSCTGKQFVIIKKYEANEKQFIQWQALP